MIDYLSRLASVIQDEDERNYRNEARARFDAVAPGYKNRLGASFVLINGNKIAESISGTDFCVTRKIDGEMRTVFFDGASCIMYTTGGKEESGFPCLARFADILKAAGLKAGGFACELNVRTEDRRCRVQDVIHAVFTEGLHDSLVLTPFDILFLDDALWAAENYDETYGKLTELFSGTDCQPVEMEKAETVSQVEDIYTKWVEEEKAEGLVVHSNLPVIWKIKPRHTIDAVAVGYTINEENAVRDILFATMDDAQTYRLFAHGGNGLSDHERISWMSRFQAIKTASPVVCPDSRGVAFQLVEPKYVFEVTAIDFSNENSRAEPNRNKLIRWTEDGQWRFVKNAGGVSTYGLTIVRLRHDKTAVHEQVRSSQISHICPFSEETGSVLKRDELAPSTILERAVYSKKTRNCTYIRKLVLLKTNKEKTGRFPSYILHFTDFSSNRKNPLEKRIWVSEDKAQLEAVMQKQISKIPGSWVNVSKWR